jgi:hypothetical protein
MNNDGALPIGQKVFFPGHFDVRVMLEEARMLGSWHECRFRLPDGCRAEAVLSFREAASLAKSVQPSTTSVQSANPKKIRLLMEGARVSGWLIFMTASSPSAFREFKRVPVNLGLSRDRGV